LASDVGPVGFFLTSDILNKKKERKRKKGKKERKEKIIRRK
jgi:hypothetical protein